MTASALTGCGGASDKKDSGKKEAKGTVYYLNFKPEADAQWQELAKLYTDKTGVKVNVVTAAANQYETTLKSGKLFMYEEKGNDSWFCLEDYVVEEKDRKYSLVKTETPCRIAIRLADAKRIELFYGVIEKSKVRIWLENNKYFKRFFKKSN